MKIVASNISINITSQQLKRSRDKFEKASELKYLWSSVTEFDRRNNYFLCGKQTIIDRKHPQRNLVHEVKSHKPTETILRICDERQDE